ncbi:unnamed protein product [Rodentolepis nana]|uniref:Organic anion transporter n=1 Tax=Rodentolepis nana TaxID=102285 RepID=A0A0R3T0Q3_RODNA|nr:unnamed protein product [Rodentolepis nana]
MEIKLSEDSSPPWQTKETDSTKDPKVDHCGIGLWRPSCLEPLRDIRAFIAAMCFVSCLQASFSGYTSSQITTIEKRFAIGSIVIGTINSFFEVGYISCVMIVSYLGAKGRVPLWISCGLFAMSCGAFLFSTPQFLFPYNPSLSTHGHEHLCSKNLESQNFSSKTYCNTKEFGSFHFLPILLFAQFLIGAGSSPILTLAPPFVDDHVPASKAPAMIASLYASAALGPVFGYALGALMLQHPMDKWSKQKVIGSQLTPASEDWIGLWWAGYIILGLGVLIGAYILIMFPRTLRSTFTPHKRSLESSVIIPGSISPSPALEDSNRIPIGVNSSQGISGQQALPSSSSYQNRASYQCHKRSFSGNVPFISASPTPNSNTNFFPPRPRHQRSASVSSILLHAAIIAATASHAAEEDEALPSTDTYSESSSDDEYFSASPHETERPNERRSRIDQTGTNESKVFHSPIYRSKSLTARQQHQHHRRWASSFWSSSRSYSRCMPASRLSRRSQNTADSLGIPPPILDVMVEDTTAEASTISNVPNVS